MARGYSASRSNSKRPTLRLKRERSVSMHAVRSRVEANAAVNVAEASVRSDEVADVMKRKQQDPPAAPEGSRTARSQSKRPRSASGGPPAEAQKRSASTLRMKIAEMEAEMESDLEPSEDERETVEKPDVMTKYKSAGKVVDEVLDLLAAACVPGANTKALCDLGDAEMTQRLKTLFSKAKDESGKRIQKGICYPTNISVNEVLCNHAPFRDDESVVLRGMQVVKLHCGCHLDGYPVVAARTVVVAPPLSATTGPAAAASYILSRSGSNAIEAARVAMAGMVRMLRPGTLNADITDFISTVGAAFGAEAIEGVLSNRVKRWVLDGVDCIITRRIVDTVPQQDVDECEVAPYQVWALDVAFTNALGTDHEDASGDHEAQQHGNEEAADAEKPTHVRGTGSVDDKKCFRTTPTEEAVAIFRRTPVDFTADARVQQANEVLKEITDRFGCFPFHFRHLSTPLKAKLGINTLVKHQILEKMSPLRVKNSLSGRRITARFSATVAVTGKRITVLCGAPPEQPVTHLLPSPVPQPRPYAGLLPDIVVEVLSQPLEFGTTAALKAVQASSEPKQKRARIDKS